jgi:EpsI family protein
MSSTATAQASNSTARPLLGILVCAELGFLYSRAAIEMVDNWTMVDTYYAHGFFIPCISTFLIWRQRKQLRDTGSEPSVWGFLWIACAALMLLLGDFLGFRVAGHLSLLPMLTGLSLLWFGASRTRKCWFPIAYLAFMIPLPGSVVQSVAFELKLFASQAAVGLANALTLPIVQSGSSIHFGHDSLLVGDVCGGLRSLVALLALGALVAHMSELRTWGKLLILALSGPIAVASNILRIFVLCVTGYFYGSETAAGWVHDASGVGIFVIAVALFLSVLSILNRIARAPVADKDGNGAEQRGLRQGISLKIITAVTLACAAVLHGSILRAQATVSPSTENTIAAIPERIADYRQQGPDVEIDERTRQVLETSSILTRHYAAPSGRPVQLTMVRTGATRRSLHFPEVCLIGDGWEIHSESNQPLGLALTAKRLVLVRGNSTQAVLYWFKTGDRMTGNFFMNAWYWTQNQVRFQTPASTMVKLATPVTASGDEPAFAALEDFALKLMPALYEYAP